MRRLMNYTGLVAAYVRLNFNAQLEYRAAFVSQVVAMFVNDLFWVGFWILYFTRFPVLRGWDVRDVITVWAVATAGFGIAYAIFGNAWQLAALIVRGELDGWMLYPRALLPHMLLGRTVATAMGDALFGYAVYVYFVRPDATHFALFVILTLTSAVLFVGFGVVSGSVAFYVGNSASLSEQWRFAMVTFSTYPATVFQGVVKVLLSTAIPALFINLYPIEALRNLSLRDAGISALGSFAVLIAGTIVFHHGLKRYESGNLVAMRE